MKSLQESLFDSDLVSKDISILSIITNYLSDYLNGNTGNRGSRHRQWLSTMREIADGISYKKPATYMISPDEVEKIGKDELYVNIDRYLYNQIVLIGWGLVETNASVPTIVILSYSPGLKNICADLYQTKTVNYKYALSSFKFNRYKVNKEDINLFKKEVLDKIENIF